MKKYIITGLVIFCFPLLLSAPVGSFNPQILNAQVKLVVATTSIKDMINIYAEMYAVPSSTIDKVVNCETAGTYDPLIQSLVINHGVREESYGLAQIHLPDWPDIKKEDATNPNFALNFLASHLSLHQGYLWTCYRKLKPPN